MRIVHANCANCATKGVTNVSCCTVLFVKGVVKRHTEGRNEVCVSAVLLSPHLDPHRSWHISVDAAVAAAVDGVGG